MYSSLEHRYHRVKSVNVSGEATHPAILVVTVATLAIAEKSETWRGFSSQLRQIIGASSFPQVPEGSVLASMIPTSCICVEDSTSIFKVIELTDSLCVVFVVVNEGLDGLEDGVLPICSCEH